MMVKIRGVSYSVETYGEGRPLVLLHGFTGSAETWHPLLNMFQSCQVILIDLIGHGRTDSPADYRRYSMEETVLDLHALFKELELDKPVLAGYSMGGRAALSYAVRYPETVSKLILESCTPGLLSSEERKKRQQSDKELAEMISEKGIPHFVQHWEEIPLFASQKELPEAIQNRERSKRLKNNAAGLSNSLLGMGTGSQTPVWTGLSSLHIPVLLICGERDEKFCRLAEEMKGLLPLSTYIKMKDAGHAVHVEQPQIFGKIVNEFVNK